MEEETNQEAEQIKAEQLEQKRKAAAEYSRQRTARLRAMGLSSRGKPLKERHKKRDAFKQLQYQAAHAERRKAARERLGLTIREFMELPQATRIAEYNKLKGTPVDRKDYHGQAYYSQLTPEKKHKRYIQQQLSRLKRLGKNPDFGCSYCEFATDSAGGLQRHMKFSHPDAKALVEIRPRNRVNNVTEQRENTDKALVERIIQTVATMIYRDMKGKE